MAGRGTDIQLGGNVDMKLADWREEQRNAGTEVSPDQALARKAVIEAEIADLKKLVAHAHEGENLTPLQKHRVMAGSTAPSIAIDPTPAPKSGPQIGLYLGSELSSDVMQYVMQTCSRLKHGLTVLTFQSEADAQALLKPYQTELEETRIGVQLTVLGGEPPAALVQALRKRTEIAFLICNESGYLGRSLMKGIVRQDAFPVPVVIVAASGTAMAKPEQAETSARRNAQQ